jgi:hypothetical protein
MKTKYFTPPKGHLAMCLAALSISISISGCIHRQGNNRPVTNYEQVMVWNDALAQANDHIARGIIEVSPSLVAPERAAVVLREQRSIALIDEQLTTILKQGPDLAKLSSARVQVLLDQLKQSVRKLIDGGAMGVKNPATRQTFDADIQAVGSLVDNIFSGLRQAGVVQ